MKLILGDRQEITRWAISQLTQQSGFWPEIEVLAVKGLQGLKKAVKEAVSEQKEVLVVLDYTQMDCTEDDLQHLSQRFTSIQFLLFSDQLSREFLRRMIYSSNQFSVLMKECSLEEIHTCLREISHNRQFVCQRVLGLIESADKPEHTRPQLSPTEKEILKSLSLGHTTKDIASERFLSIYTVMTHRKNIFRKLGVNNAQEAIRYAMRAGIVDPMEYYI